MGRTNPPPHGPGGRRQSRYSRLADKLIADIAGARYPVGSLLPTEAELCARHRVSRHTVRDAVRQVQALGLISRRAGIGTRVIAEVPAREYVHAIDSIDGLSQFAESTRLIQIKAAMVTANRGLAEAGGFTAGQRLLRLEALRVPARDPAARPLAWTEIYIVEAYAGIRDFVGRHEGAIGHLIEEHYGETIQEIRQRIAAVAIPESLADSLTADSGGPALRVDRWYVGRAEHVFEYTVSVSPADRNPFTMRLRRQG